MYYSGMLTCRTGDNVDIVIWSILETFMAIVCASLMCIRPLLVKYVSAIFPATKVSEGRSSGPKSLSWGQRMSLKAASKLRNGNHGVELLSDDDEARMGQTDTGGNTTWLTENSTVMTQSIELEERSPTMGKHH